MKSSHVQVMKTSNLKGNVFDIKRFATHDGEGIRTTLFLKGCPLRCVWCQNPEGLNQNKQILYLENTCMLCANCVSLSKNKGITLEDNHLHIKREIHEDWDNIIDNCPTQALCYDSKTYSIKDVMWELEKDEIFYKRGGGITISGGEPFLQFDFMLEILKECKKHGIHTALESSFYTDLEKVKQALPFIDQIYADMKLFNDELHDTYTGVSNQKIKENITYLLQSDKRNQVIVRTPLIPNITATDENIINISKFIYSSYDLVHYELLNYNPLAKAKYSYLDMQYCFDENPKLFTNDQMEHFYSLAKRNGIQNLIIE